MSVVKTRSLVKAMRKSEGSTKEALRRAVIDRTEQMFRPTLDKQYIDKGCTNNCVCGNACLH